MGLFNRKSKGTKAKMPTGAVVGTAPSGFYASDILNFYYRFGSFDNTYPNISRIADAISEVMPYAVDAKGDKLKTPPRVIAALYRPNKSMSVVQFIETLAVLALVWPKVYILCWRQDGKDAVAGGDITADNICGFTFLEQPEIKIYADGHKTYKIIKDGFTNIWSDKEVIEISLSANPYGVVDGYSPSMAAKKWSNTDDYIADYQAGFFKNGAVPAGQFTITAGSVEAFDNIVADMQAHHRGPNANNNVRYVHRPINDLGQPLAGQIEWTPYQQANNQLSLKEIFEQANKKIDMAFGVPQEVKGYLTNSNYASVAVADYVFARRVVYPKLVKIWSQFTHELNRITGGLGYAISFDYEIPILEEQRKAQVENLTKILDKGFTLESAVEALQLPKSFLKLAKPEEEKTEEVLPDVEGIDLNEEPNQNTTAKSVELKKKLVDANPRVEEVVVEYTKSVIGQAQNGKVEDTEKNAKRFKTALFLVLLYSLDEEGQKEYDATKTRIESAGYDMSHTSKFHTPEDTEKAYSDYLDSVSLSYTEDTNQSIKNVLEQAQIEGWDEAQIRTELGKIMDTDQWRIDRLARTETHRVQELGKLSAARQLQTETGAKIWKVWHVNPFTENHCETCESLDGVRLPLDGVFGYFDAGADNVADAHPNCSCFLTFEIDSAEKMVKVHCPHCKRIMLDSGNSNIKGITCQGCKKRFDLDIFNGNIKATEIEKENDK